tara:strand:+ start:153 stop:440 length:288 start_codon:yes stop_codon:yes gene_type:complete
MVVRKQKIRDTLKLLLVAFYVFLTIFLLTSCAEDFITPAGCINESQITPYKDRVCTMEVDYTCGCNGQLYINPCHAAGDGVTETWPATVKSNCKQ